MLQGTPVSCVDAAGPTAGPWLHTCTASRRTARGWCSPMLCRHNPGTGGGCNPKPLSSSLLHALMTFNCGSTCNTVVGMCLQVCMIQAVCL
jgi:hypothetical protein